MFAHTAAVKATSAKNSAKTACERPLKYLASQQEPAEAFNTPRFSWNIGNIALWAPPDHGGPNSGEDGRSWAPRHLGRLPGLMQAKLDVGAVDDPLESEADRVADHVMHMPDPRAAARPAVTGALPPAVRRKCACGGSCEKCKGEASDEEHGRVQRKPLAPQISTLSSSPGNSGMEAPPIVHEVLRSPGKPLDARTRAYFEPRFGYDFSRVRVHRDGRAAESARTVNALAYTVGNHIALGDSPDSESGQRILAHELTHVVQKEKESAPTLRRITVTPLRQHLSMNGAGCGDEHFIEYDFELDKPAPCDGYIVQQVDIYEQIHEDCNRCPNQMPQAPTTTYWEAWWLAKGGTLQELRTIPGAVLRMLNRPQHDYQGTTFTDRPRITHTQETCGISMVQGTIKFYCATASGRRPGTGDLGKEDEAPANPHGDWGPNRNFGGTTPGWLPATDKKPPFWDQPAIEGPASRLTGNRWNCCRGQTPISLSFASPFKWF